MSAIVILIGLVLWEVAAHAGWIARIFFPPPTTKMSPFETTLFLEADCLAIQSGGDRYSIISMVISLLCLGEMRLTLRGFNPWTEYRLQCHLFHALAEWAAKQDNHVHCYRFALGDRTGQADLLTIPSRLQASSLFPATAWLIDHPMLSIPVEVFRLDDVFANLSLTDDVLVKIDTEGFDKCVILGGMAVLRHAAACIVEVFMKKRFAGQPTFHEFIDLLEEAELKYVGNLYQHQAIGQNGSIGRVDALFIKQDLLPIYYRG